MNLPMRRDDLLLHKTKREFMADKIIARVYVSSVNVISVVPDPIDCPMGHHEIDIEWHIETSGWKFAPNGIVHRDNGDGTFHGRRPGDSVFHWTNRNHRAGTYRYIVNVVSTDGKTPLTVDPAIQNHGDSVGGKR
jgi:hypothetical protein